MHYPERYRALDLVRLNDQGEPIDWPETYSFAEAGFYWFPVFELGNGDVHGFYWPIGKEDHEPIICETYHDAWQLEPHASSFEALIRLRWTHGFSDEEDHRYEELVYCAQRLGLQLPAPRFSQEYLTPTLAELASADPSSPAVLVKVGKGHLERSELDAAERCLRSALEILPEYTEAHWMLAGLYRRSKRPAAAVERMLHVLRCSPCFGGDAQKCLHWLQRYRDDEFPHLADDPLWRARRQITFKTGVKLNDDYLIFRDAIAWYMSNGRFFEGITLRMTYAARMCHETHPFQERYGFTWKEHRKQLKQDFIQAGLEARANSVPIQ